MRSSKTFTIIYTIPSHKPLDHLPAQNKNRTQTDMCLHPSQLFSQHLHTTLNKKKAYVALAMV